MKPRKPKVEIRVTSLTFARPGGLERAVQNLIDLRQAKLEREKAQR